jgi:hypothetical protein
MTELKDAFLQHLQALPSPEAEELYRRVREFEQLKLAIIEATT